MNEFFFFVLFVLIAYLIMWAFYARDVRDQMDIHVKELEDDRINAQNRLHHG